MSSAIAVRGLRKSYSGVEAVRGVDFEVEEGEVFGLLGPNGAGKTTTVEILEGYRTRDAGEVSVLGHDPAGAPRALRERIGVVLQHSEHQHLLTVREVHRMYAGYFDRPRDVDDVIELVGLATKRDAKVKTLSGGQKRRLDLGVALVGDPDLVFLDEPTTGFDPAARRSAWEMIRSLRSLGKTILLTTHYLDEAQLLADRVAVISEGLIVSQGAPAELIGGSARVEIRFRRDGQPVTIETDDPTRALHELTGEALAAGTVLEHLGGAPPDARGRLPRARPGRRRGRCMRLLVHQLRFDQLVFWRSREAAVFIFIFPIMLYLLLGSVYSEEIEIDGVDVPSGDVLLAGLFGYGAANTAFGGLAIILVNRRELGMLKRIRSTPLPPATYFAAVLLSMLLVFALEAVALLVLGRLAFDASAPANWLGFAGAVVLGVACFASLGVGAAALIRSAEGVSAVVNVVLLPMAFLSGAFGPTRDYPGLLQTIADVLPLTHFLEIVNGVYLDGESLFADPTALAVVGAWAAVGLAIALTRFSWMPRDR